MNDKKANNIEILELIKARRTIRRYKDKPVPKKSLNKIIEAGRWASSIHGFQPWKFIVIKKRVLIEKISDILMKKSRRESIGSRIFLSSSAETIINAQALIIIYNSKSFSKFASSLSKEYVRFAGIAELSAISSAIQNMILTAESLGISSCWLSITLFCENEINKICNIKEDELVSVLSLGYPKEKGKRSQRKPISEAVKYL